MILLVTAGKLGFRERVSRFQQIRSAIGVHGGVLRGLLPTGEIFGRNRLYCTATVSQIHCLGAME